ncbi:MAG: hypothetical protein MZU79_08965 [Anaerotruncus sp.]|nr:hypothetical protein [Anaerotruncus sp.]
MNRGRVLQVGKPWELYLSAGQPLRGRFHRDHERLPWPAGRPGGTPPACDAMVTTFGERWQVRPPRCAGGHDLGRGPSRVAGAGAVAHTPDEAWNSLTGTVVEAAYLGAVVRYGSRSRTARASPRISTIPTSRPSGRWETARRCGFGARLCLLPDQASEA